jgi:hypothetical protein
MRAGRVGGDGGPGSRSPVGRLAGVAVVVHAFLAPVRLAVGLAYFAGRAHSGPVLLAVGLLPQGVLELPGMAIGLAAWLAETYVSPRVTGWLVG